MKSQAGSVHALPLAHTGAMARMQIPDAHPQNTGQDMVNTVVMLRERATFISERLSRIFGTVKTSQTELFGGSIEDDDLPAYELTLNGQFRRMEAEVDRLESLTSAYAH